MIIEFLSGAIAAVVMAAVSLLPSSSWSPDSSGFNTVIGYVKGLNSVLPIDLLLTLFAVGVFFTQTSLGWDFFLFLYRKLPFVGGS